MFYRLDDGVVSFGEFIDGQGYTLSIAGKDEHSYPVDGWFWFDTKEEAYESFGLEMPEEVGFMTPTRAMPVF